MTTAIATWIAVKRTDVEILDVQTRLKHLRPFKQKLVIYDEDRIAAVRRISERMFECTWDIYIPSGKTKYLVVEGDRVALLKPGIHKVEWSTNEEERQGGFRAASLRLNEEVVYHLDEGSRVVSWLATFKGDGGLYELTDCSLQDNLELAADPKSGRSLIWIE